ncbi:MAG: electron transfer flavoprotein subunit beta/FixA family protein [Bacteroidales bacterium]|nr:electron transfer flavoprotein subunit beta/FixA family protein [Bacteroidales bacterium]
MKILVCISNVPDTTTRIRFNEGDSSIDVTGIQWVINPWDELSLTRALEMKDDPSSGIQSVTVAHVGASASEPTIRKALAIGADDAVRINAESTDASFVAAQLAEAVRTGNYDIILCGIESSDFNGSAVGGMLAEILEIASVSAVSDIKIENGVPILTRELDGGRELVTVAAPVVAIVQKGIAKEPRIASMRGIMLARTKQIRVLEPVPAEPLTQIASLVKAAPRSACRFVDPEHPSQLIDLLRNEAKII